jgi:hypothetical protein
MAVNPPTNKRALAMFHSSFLRSASAAFSASMHSSQMNALEPAKICPTSVPLALQNEQRTAASSGRGA